MPDMFGNVWEWGYDELDRLVLKDKEGFEDEAMEPVDRQERGGRWLEYAACCRFSTHSSMPPGERDASTGFCIARTIKKER